MNFIRIVLVKTSHPGNIGSTARAMKTMGLNRLYLVQPKIFPHKKAIDLAAGALDILDNAMVTNSLAEAVADCNIIFATSARSRELSLPVLTPAESANLLVEQTEKKEVAFVFGTEHSGLSNDELMQCNYQIKIPANPNYSSLNLAQAVQIICYELNCRVQTPLIFNQKSMESDPFDQDHVASNAEIEQFYQHLQQVLQEINFLKPENPKKLMLRLRRLYNRTKLESREVNILRGMLSEIQNALNRKING